ncbi:MAG: ferritin-like domain-containing protein [bacterium]
MSDFYTRVRKVLLTSSPEEKVRLSGRLYEDWYAGRLSREPLQEPGGGEVESFPAPGRPAQPKLVRPRDLKQRKLSSEEGRAALIHAICHIEFNAINLALDAVYRFRHLPDAYYTDWLQVAREEAYHFSLLEERLKEMGYAYGDFPAHNGLWEMALKTEGDVLHRMALVPRVYEARGLDVTPPMMQRLREAGEERAVAILEIILRDEIGHVKIGNRWYYWACERAGCEPVATFRRLIKQYMNNKLAAGFNYEARIEAGFSEMELRELEASLKV